MARVLIIEDDPNVAELVGRLVERAGYETVVTRTVLEALGAMHGDEPIDVILTDYFLGGSDGLSLVDSLREYSPGIPAIVATANNSPELIEAAESRGIAHMVKPFLGADVAVAIEKALAMGRAKQGDTT